VTFLTVAWTVFCTLHTPLGSGPGGRADSWADSQCAADSTTYPLSSPRGASSLFTCSTPPYPSLTTNRGRGMGGWIVEEIVKVRVGSGGKREEEKKEREEKKREIGGCGGYRREVVEVVSSKKKEKEERKREKKEREREEKNKNREREEKREEKNQVSCGGGVVGVGEGVDGGARRRRWSRADSARALATVMRWGRRASLPTWLGLGLARPAQVVLPSHAWSWGPRLVIRLPFCATPFVAGGLRAP
jgi:hypothetical protein